MKRKRCTTLVLHRSAAWRRHVEGIITGTSLPCVTADGWGEWSSNPAGREQVHGREERLTVKGVSQWVQRLRRHLQATYAESTQALVAAVEAKDPYTRSHSQAVARYAEAISRRLSLSDRQTETICAAALLHDVGKIGVPDAILVKPGPLTEEEFTVMKRHPETALQILGHVGYLSDERPLILHHHERFDGSGYPAGLAGNAIPIGARILAVVDALDTMLSPRSYKQAYSIEQVREELHVHAGRQFDPAIVAVTLEWLDARPRAGQSTPSASGSQGSVTESVGLRSAQRHQRS